MNMDIRNGLAIATAIREAKEKAQGKNSYSIPLMAELFPATISDTIKEQDEIIKNLKALENRKAELTNLELAEMNRLKSREQALARHLLSLGYKENEIQYNKIDETEILEKLKAQGIDISNEELKNYM